MTIQLDHVKLSRSNLMVCQIKQNIWCIKCICIDFLTSMTRLEDDKLSLKIIINHPDREKNHQELILKQIELEFNFVLIYQKIIDFKYFSSR